MFTLNVFVNEASKFGAGHDHEIEVTKYDDIVELYAESAGVDPDEVVDLVIEIDDINGLMGEKFTPSELEDIVNALDELEENGMDAVAALEAFVEVQGAHYAANIRATPDVIEYQGSLGEYGDELIEENAADLPHFISSNINTREVARDYLDDNAAGYVETWNRGLFIIW